MNQASRTNKLFETAQQAGACVGANRHAGNETVDQPRHTLGHQPVKVRRLSRLEWSLPAQDLCWTVAKTVDNDNYTLTIVQHHLFHGGLK